MHPSCRRNHRSDCWLAFRACICMGPIVFALAAHGFRSGTSGSGFAKPTSSRLRLEVMHTNNDGSEMHDKQRRRFMVQSSASIASLFVPLLLPPHPQHHAALAINDLAEQVLVPQPQTRTPYTRTPPSPTDKFQFSYTVTPPPSFVASNKPLKTHLDEINFAPPDARGYTLGITVDPVRISSIQQFGSPEEVAARVVTAEVNRDGVFEVTLAKDPKEDKVAVGGDGGYDIEYVSDGKRGKKRFVTRIYVKDGFLYVLTVQSKESEYDKIREAEVLECVKSFKPL